MHFIDYYAELGLARSATAQEIRYTYRKLARQYHPDLNPEAGTEEKFKRIAEAYEVLGDTSNRRKYDLYGQAWKARKNGTQPPPGYEDFDLDSPEYQHLDGPQFRSGRRFSDFFEAFFDKHGEEVFGEDAAEMRTGSDQEATLELSLEDACIGGKHSFTFSDAITGKLKTLEINIPPGVRSGQKIRLKGLGAEGELGGGRGDLFLCVKINEPTPENTEALDIHTIFDVAPWDAALGGEATIYVSGDLIQVMIPACSSSGHKIKIEGKGSTGSGGSVGDLYVELRVVLPRSLSDMERKLFEALASTSSFNPDRQHS